LDANLVELPEANVAWGVFRNKPAKNGVEFRKKAALSPFFRSSLIGFCLRPLFF